MVIVPLFGGHLCPEEVIPMLAGAASVPFIGPAAQALIARLRKQQPAKVHCCDPEHRPDATLPVFNDELPAGGLVRGDSTVLLASSGGRSLTREQALEFLMAQAIEKGEPGFIVAKPGAKPLPDIDLDPLPTVKCADGHEGCRGDDAFVEGGGLCYCTNIRGVHGRRVSCPPKES
jgi:hypothetical protein